MPSSASMVPSPTDALARRLVAYVTGVAEGDTQLEVEDVSDGWLVHAGAEDWIVWRSRDTLGEDLYEIALDIDAERPVLHRAIAVLDDGSLLDLKEPLELASYWEQTADR